MKNSGENKTKTLISSKCVFFFSSLLFDRPRKETTAFHFPNSRCQSRHETEWPIIFWFKYLVSRDVHVRILRDILYSFTFNLPCYLRKRKRSKSNSYGESLRIKSSLRISIETLDPNHTIKKLRCKKILLQKKTQSFKGCTLKPPVHHNMTICSIKIF